MPSPGLLLGVDLGSSATKAVLVDPGRGVVASTSRPVELHVRHPGWAEADPGVWWDNATTVIRSLLASTSVASDVRAVAVAGMVPAVVCVDSAGCPVRFAILQNDARSVTEIQELRSKVDDADLLARTGSVLTQQSVAPTLLWLARHEPGVWDRTATVLGSYDWLASALGARQHVERNWSLEGGLFDWDGQPIGDLLAAAGVDPRLFPPVVEPGTVVGAVSSPAARDTGLAAGTPIVVGGADHVLSAYGAGLSQPGDWLVKLGGAGDVLAVSDDRLLDPRLYLDAHPSPGLWLPNGCMATSGSLLRWLQGILGDADLPALDEEAASRQPAALICLPYFLGEKSPLHDPDLRGAFVGLHLATTRADLHRACLEAVAYGFRQHCDVFAERGLALGTARVTNGGSASSLWKQILADVLGRPLVPVLDHPGAALGAAFAAGVGTHGVANWDAVSAVVRLGEPIDPGPGRVVDYDEGYALFQALGPAVRPLSHALAGRSRA